MNSLKLLNYCFSLQTQCTKDRPLNSLKRMMVSNPSVINEASTITFHPFINDT